MGNIWREIKDYFAIVGIYVLTGAYWSGAEAKRFIRWALLSLLTAMAGMAIGIWLRSPLTILVASVGATITILTARWVLEQSVELANAIAEAADKAAKAAANTANAATSLLQPPLPPVPVPGAIFGPITAVIKKELEDGFLPTFNTFAICVAFAGPYVILKGPEFVTFNKVLIWLAFSFGAGLIIRMLKWRAQWLEKILLVVLGLTMAAQVFPVQFKAVIGRLKSFSLGVSQDLNQKRDPGVVGVQFNTPIFNKEKPRWYSRSEQLTPANWPVEYKENVAVKVITAITDPETGEDLYEVVFPTSPQTPNLFIGGKKYYVPVRLTRSLEPPPLVAGSFVAPPAPAVDVPWLILNVTKTPQKILRAKDGDQFEYKASEGFWIVEEDGVKHYHNPALRPGEARYFTFNDMPPDGKEVSIKGDSTFSIEYRVGRFY